MGRPVKQTVDYFPHVANASNEDTLTVLQSRYGNDGYAFWFKLLEKLCSTDGHYLDCRGPMKWQLLLAKTGVSELLGKEIMLLLVEMKAIDKELWDSKLIWCQKLVDNLAHVYKNRGQELPQRPVVTDLNPVSTNNNPKTITDNTHSIVKDSIVKDSKEHGEFKNVLLTDEEYQKLIDRFGDIKTKRLIECLSIGIKSKGYKYKSHYATILNWEKRDVGTGTHREHPRAVPKPGDYTNPEDIGR
ncbi:MAG: DUF4373 domain-containing protein [Deltaproteobacteria bacterium]|nr:DUF4373 domain-containing protein [Deltaproteobacteria bacterium]